MEAPDKIYLHRTTGNPRNNGKVHSYKPAKIRDDDKIIEYIRKEALLEFINEKLQESADRLDFRTNRAYAELLDKINSL